MTMPVGARARRVAGEGACNRRTCRNLHEDM